jgi:hypothetical protein
MTTDVVLEITGDVVEAGKHWLRGLSLKRQLISRVHNYLIEMPDLNFRCGEE